MKRQKEHCNHYVLIDTPSFKINHGDCTRPIKGRWNPNKCLGVCDKYNDTAYNLKQSLMRV